MTSATGLSWGLPVLCWWVWSGRFNRASERGPAGLVLAGPVLVKILSKKIPRVIEKFGEISVHNGTVEIILEADSTQHSCSASASAFNI